MNQPELGNKVSELRQQQQLTQEKLAELCEVSTRTIQRIESGEVDPRSYTITCLSDALEYDFSAEPSSSENVWLALLHLSSMLNIVIIPLLLWSWKKNESPRIDKEGRLVLNFQITMTLCLFGSLILLMFVPVALAFMGDAGIPTMDGSPMFMLLVMLTPVPLVLIGLFCTYQGVVNAMRSLSGKPVRYALSIPFVR